MPGSLPAPGPGGCGTVDRGSGLGWPRHASAWSGVGWSSCTRPPPSWGAQGRGELREVGCRQRGWASTARPNHHRCSSGPVPGPRVVGAACVSGGRHTAAVGVESDAFAPSSASRAPTGPVRDAEVRLRPLEWRGRQATLTLPFTVTRTQVESRTCHQQGCPRTPGRPSCWGPVPGPWPFSGSPAHAEHGMDTQLDRAAGILLQRHRPRDGRPPEPPVRARRLHLQRPAGGHRLAAEATRGSAHPGRSRA